MNNILAAFIITSIAGLSTVLGTSLLFVKDKNQRILKYSLSFAAGIMISVCIFDIFPESMEYLSSGFNKNNTFILMFVFIVLGILLSFIIDKLVPENEESSGLYKLGLFSMIAIILHNIPEGIASFMACTTNLDVGMSLAVAISLHNIPEGLSIAIPIYHSTKSKKRAILYTLIAGAAEPVGGLLAYIFLSPFLSNVLLGIVLSIIGGIMLHIALFELLPTSLKYKGKKKILLIFIVGFSVMLLNHLFLHHH